MGVMYERLKKQLDKLPFDKARIACDSEGIDDSVKADYAQVLKEHKGNPANLKPSSNGHSAQPVDPELTALLVSYPTPGAAMKAMMAGSLTNEQIEKLTAHFDKPVVRSSGKPYVLKNGQTVAKNPNPKFLLLRDVTSNGKARKWPTLMFFVLKGKDIEGKGLAGNVMLTEPMLRALVTVHGIGGVFAEGLKAFDDGTIAVSREKEDEDGE